MKIIIAKLDHQEHCGDWHDKPLRWSVSGPGSELQKFITKKDATLFRRIRRNSPDFNTASRLFAAS